MPDVASRRSPCQVPLVVLPALLPIQGDRDDHRLLVPSLFAALLLAGPALAQKPFVSQQEQLKQLLQRFPDADANRDGTLTREEAQAYRAKLRGQDAKQPGRKPPAPTVTPTHANVHYGPHERQVLDFYQAKSSEPTPVIVYIHGADLSAATRAV